MKYKNQKGITLIALIITIVILLIIATIGVFSGGNIIKNAKLESLKTNMLLIQAKSKEYVEEVSFKKGPVEKSDNIENIRNEIYVQKGKLISVLENVPKEVRDLVDKISNDSMQYYYVPREALDNIGLTEVKEGKNGDYYVIGFDEENVVTEIYHTVGFENDGQQIYSLTELEKIEEVK